MIRIDRLIEIILMTAHTFHWSARITIAVAVDTGNIGMCSG